MLYSVYISFTNWDFMSEDYDFVGLKNYENLLSSQGFYEAFGNTVYFMVGSIIPTMVGGLLLALLVHKKMAGVGFYRTILFSPWITPMVAVSIVWSWIFEPRVGVANWILSLFHLPQLEWLGSSTWAMPAVIIVTVWKGVGWAMIFYLDALKKIPPDLYEAASLDGASKWYQFRHITLPLISPTTFFLSIILAIDLLQAYDQIQILTQGGPSNSTRTLLYMYYQSAFEQFNVGEATAIATVIIVLAALLSVVQFWISKKWVHYD
ncbi:ABC transporter [Bacillaceae bacterium SAOS 7]|nr:ABC transporter [Bacillaceae bacterium SAOS 7]